MKIKDSILIVISALLYTLPFWSLSFFWWVVIFPFAFLLFFAYKRPVSFNIGFAWGVIVFGLHGVGCTVVTIAMADQLNFFAGFFMLLVIVYYAASAGICFLLSDYCAFWLMPHDRSMRMITLSGFLIVFIIWVDRYSLFIFGCCEGYPFLNPSLLLCNRIFLPTFLFPLADIAILIWLLIFSFFGVYSYVYKNKIALFAGISCILLNSFFLYRSNQLQKPLWLERIAVFSCQMKMYDGYEKLMFKIVADKMTQLVTNYPHTELIIMPESAFDCANFFSYSPLLSCWNDVSIGRNVSVLCGASRTEGADLFNTFYLVRNGVIEHYYDKSHAMLLSERLPYWLDCSLLQSMYRSNNKKDICCGIGQRPNIIIDGIGRCAVFICSELFFTRFQNTSDDADLIIVLVNDSMFLVHWCSEYMIELLVACARFKAIMWQKDILYVSYSNSYFIGRHGELFEL